MRAQILTKPKTKLLLKDVPIPTPGKNQVLIQVKACGVCRTDLHIVDGELTAAKFPLIPGHQIVGIVAKLGNEVHTLKEGMRVGVPWLGHVCQQCEFCLSQRENLCDQAQFTGYQIDGGFAEFCVADERFTFPLPKSYDLVKAAPLLCAGLIGYRSWNKVPKNAKTVGFYGFGAAAHILIQIATYENKEVFAFTRPEDEKTQKFAHSLGARWVGNSTSLPPKPLDAAIIFAPVGQLVPQALKAVKKGGRVILAGIHMSPIPSFAYNLLWEERSIHSIANLTRDDGTNFLKIAPKIPIKTAVTPYPLENSNQALDDLRSGHLNGAAVLVL